MATQSLCFRDAANAKRDGRISLENYLQHILSHYNGVRHESDVPGQDVWLGSDHFAISVRNSVIRDGFVPLEDTSGLYRIFLNAYHGNIALAEEAAESSGISSNYFIQPLAIVAALVGSDSLLSFCLHHGATIKHEPEFLAVMKSSKPGNATLDLLLEFDFEEWKTKGLSTSMYLALSWGPGATRWFLGHGAKNSARDLVYYWPIPSSDVVKVLLDHYGIDWFKGSCFLQFAAKKPDIQIVKMLAKAGADVNENPTPFGDPREGYEPYCALIEAMVADAYKTQQDDTVRFLVDHGARLTRQDLKRYFFRPSPAMEKMIQVVESMGGIVE